MSMGPNNLRHTDQPAWSGFKFGSRPTPLPTFPSDFPGSTSSGYPISTDHKSNWIPNLGYALKGLYGPHPQANRPKQFQALSVAKPSLLRLNSIGEVIPQEDPIMLERMEQQTFPVNPPDAPWTMGQMNFRQMGRNHIGPTWMSPTAANSASRHGGRFIPASCWRPTEERVGRRPPSHDQGYFNPAPYGHPPPGPPQQIYPNMERPGHQNQGHLMPAQQFCPTWHNDYQYGRFRGSRHPESETVQPFTVRHFQSPQRNNCFDYGYWNRDHQRKPLGKDHHRNHGSKKRVRHKGCAKNITKPELKDCDNKSSAGVDQDVPDMVAQSFSQLVISSDFSHAENSDDPKPGPSKPEREPACHHRPELKLPAFSHPKDGCETFICDISNFNSSEIQEVVLDCEKDTGAQTIARNKSGQISGVVSQVDCSNVDVQSFPKTRVSSESSSADVMPACLPSPSLCDIQVGSFVIKRQSSSVANKDVQSACSSITCEHGESTPVKSVLGSVSYEGKCEGGSWENTDESSPQSSNDANQKCFTANIVLSPQMTPCNLAKRKKRRPSAKKRRQMKSRRDQRADVDTDGSKHRLSKKFKVETDKEPGEAAWCGESSTANPNPCSQPIRLVIKSVDEHSPSPKSPSPITKFAFYIHAEDLSDDSTELSDDSDFVDEDEDDEEVEQPKSTWDPFLDSSDLQPFSFRITCNFLEVPSQKTVQTPSIDEELASVSAPGVEAYSLDDELQRQIKDANSRWDGSYCDLDVESVPSKVQFVEPDSSCVHYLTGWPVEDYLDSRRGPWEQYARDQQRFQARVEDVGKSIAYCLEQEHRQLMWNKLHSLDAV